jgi:hypothetical protein
MAVSSRRLVKKHRPCYQPLAHAEITKPILFERRNPTTARPLGMITTPDQPVDQVWLPANASTDYG